MAGITSTSYSQDALRSTRLRVAAQRILDAIKTPMHLRGHELFMTASSGLHSFLTTALSRNISCGMLTARCIVQSRRAATAIRYTPPA